jgi:trimethylamine---corrinoid protein Co-methyltransferase
MKPAMRSGYSVQATPFMKLLSDDQLEEIHLASLEILRRTGCIVESEDAIEMLKKAGCRVENGNRVYFPASLVEWALKAAPSTISMCDRNLEPAMRLEGTKTYFGTGSDTVNLIDPYTGERRTWTKQDIINGMKICEYLPNIDFVMDMGIAQDVNWQTADMHHFEAIVTTTRKPMIYTALDLPSTKLVVEMAETVAGSSEAFRLNPFGILYIEPISPLNHAREQVEKVMFTAEKGIPALYMAGMMGGATGPVTAAGGLALANAEAISGLTIAQVKKEGAPIIQGGGVLNFDMTSGTASYGSPEFMASAAAIAQMAQYYKLPAWGYAGCSDAKILDEQAAIEDTFWILTAALSGSNLVHDVGYVESGITNSFENLVMCDEIIGMTKRFMSGIEVNTETLALDAIDRVGPGGNYLTDEHTLKHYKERWRPGMMDRKGYEIWQADGSLPLRDKVKAKVKWILENYEPEPLDPKIRESLRGLIETAENRVGAQPKVSRR